MGTKILGVSPSRLRELFQESQKSEKSVSLDEDILKAMSTENLDHSYMNVTFTILYKSCA